MIVDQLIAWLPTSESWPGLTFIFVVIVCAVPVFLFIAVYALVAIYGETKISSYFLHLFLKKSHHLLHADLRNL